MPRSESSSRDDRVNEAIAAYLQAVDGGETLDREKFLAEHAEIAAELKSFFADQSQFRRHAAEQTSGLASPSDSSDNSPKTPMFDPNEPTLTFQQRDVPSPKDVLRYADDCQ